MKKKSYFQVFFLNFILMLIIPFLTIILIFWKADRTVRGQTMDYALGSLERYSELFDMVIKEMSNTCQAVFVRAECSDYYSQSKEDVTSKYIQSYKVNDMLESLNDARYFDVFVYFATDDKIISATKTTLKAQRYYETYYSDDAGEGWLEFQKMIDCDSRKPALYALNSQGKTPYICVAMNAQETKKMDYTICVVLNPAYVQEIYDIRDKDENSSFMIFNEEQVVLLESNTQVDNSDILKKFSLKEIENDKWYSEEDYMLRVRACKNIQGFFAYVVLEDSFWVVLSELRVFSFLGMMLCALVSLIIAYKNTVRTYSPLDKLVSRLSSQNKMKYDKHNGSEFDFVTLILNENDKKLRESRSIHKEWYLLKLLKGGIELLDEEKISQNELLFVSERFLVCILKVDFPQEEDDNLQSFVIQNVFEELGNRNGKGYMVVVEKDEHVLLVNITGDIKQLVDDLQYGQKFCEQYFHMFITLGYSQIHENIRDIPKCYKEAKEALRYQYLFGQGSRISYTQIADRKKQSQPEAKSQTLSMLQKYISGDHSKSAIQFVEEFLQLHNISEAASMDRVELFKQNVAETLYEIVSKHSEDEENGKERVEELLKQPSLVGFRTCFAFLLQELKKGYTTDENEELLVRVKSYIDENYWNAGLSVTMLGEHMGVRGKYLSKIFKEKYQMSLPDYILQVRITQAKIFLAQKNMTIQEIAEATGFLSSQVFIRNFKDKEGITPGKFKELV